MSAAAQKPRQRLPEPEAMAPITIGAVTGKGGGGEGARWGLLLVWFMRVVALTWIALGLYYWSWIMETGTGGPSASAFLQLPIARQGAILFFAVFDFVAAIGLWLLTPWGGIVWLFTALVEIVLSTVLPQLGVGHAAALVVNGALIVMFFGLNIMASREHEGG
jgi:hypothetical protein